MDAMRCVCNSRIPLAFNLSERILIAIEFMIAAHADCQMSRSVAQFDEAKQLCTPAKFNETLRRCSAIDASAVDQALNRSIVRAFIEDSIKNQVRIIARYETGEG